MNTKLADAIILTMMIVFMFAAVIAVRMYAAKNNTAVVQVGGSVKYVPIQP